MRFVAMLAGLTALLFSIGAYAVSGSSDATLARGDKALAAKQYDVAYKEYAHLASHNGLARFDLGLIERNGWGRPADPVKACNWFEQAAHNKVPAAEQFLGDCYAQGIDRPVDGNAAVQWYMKAADAGVFYALCDAGELYLSGDIVPKDAQQGLALCARAAQLGSTPAMRRVADAYREGKSVPQNLSAARYWYGQAAERHDVEAQYRLGVMLSQGDGGDVNLPQALGWLEIAASEGYAPAYLPVAVLYANSAVDPKTGALPPDVLAKIYIWNSAAQATNHNPEERATMDRIEQLTLSVMPAQWRPDLDRRVKAYLAQHGESPSHQ
ncbi:tetratricopeptide repeat protein [Robbsia andropogonis]|uniref:tetratricopeptide repeat protein n=1 Tax=Robbsia andropogonis TaxID=28092 RepID=UPI003D1BC627